MNYFCVHTNCIVWHGRFLELLNRVLLLDVIPPHRKQQVFLTVKNEGYSLLSRLETTQQHVLSVGTESSLLNGSLSTGFVTEPRGCVTTGTAGTLGTESPPARSRATRVPLPPGPQL